MESLQNFIQRLQAGEELTITGLGDSLTQGWMVHKGFFERFIEGLRQSNSPAIIHSHNMGVPGSTAQEAIDRLYQVEEQQPDLVVVQFGLNDCSVGIPVDHYERHLEVITTTLAQQEIVVVLVTSCPVEDAVFGRYVQEYYEAVAKLGERLAVPVVRLDKYWRAQAGENSAEALFHLDGVHPTDIGHKLMAQGLLAAFNCD
jgi:acyl-CoA thioesterase I